MKEVSIIGVDLAKQVFQLHGATADCASGGPSTKAQRFVSFIRQVICPLYPPLLQYWDQ